MPGKMKTLKIVIVVVLVLIIGVAGVLMMKGFLDSEAEKHRRLIGERSDHTSTSTYPMKNGLYKKISFHNPEKRDVFIRAWAINVAGNVELEVVDSDDKVEFQRKIGKSDEPVKLSLEEGDYNIVTHFNKTFFGACVIGVNYSLDYLVELPVLPDIDNDGLPDDLEQEIGTDPGLADTDGDTLSDYYEYGKYRTNPLKGDSDGDGIEDSDWNERREYVYTIQAIVDLRPPFDVKSMNDFYQDARIVREFGDDVTRIEVILYPDAEALINPSIYKSVQNEYTQPTYTKNYSPAMKEKIENVVKGSETDIQAVIKILQDMNKTKYVSIDKELGIESDLPICFHIYRDETGRIVEEGFAKTTTYSLEEIKERVLFADSMYQLGTHGACSSISILRGAMLRAGGYRKKSL